MGKVVLAPYHLKKNDLFQRLRHQIYPNGERKGMCSSQQVITRSHTKQKDHTPLLDVNKTRSDAENTHKVDAKARNKVKALMRKAKRNFEKDVAQKSKNNPKTFWSYVPQQIEGLLKVYRCKKKQTFCKITFPPSLPMNLKDKLPSFSTRFTECIFDILIAEDMVYNAIIKLSS